MFDMFNFIQSVKRTMIIFSFFSGLILMSILNLIAALNFTVAPGKKPDFRWYFNTINQFENADPRKVASIAGFEMFRKWRFLQIYMTKTKFL